MACRDEKDEETWQLPDPSECTVHTSPDLNWIGESDRSVHVALPPQNPHGLPAKG